MEEVEIWKEIPDYPRYEASNLGRIRSWVGKRSSRRKTPKILKPAIHIQHKRLSVTLFKSWYESKFLFVHRIILTTFVGPCPEGMECCHNDGDFTNNRVENLRWDTHENNMVDAVRNREMPQGVRVASSKLNPGKVIAIRKRYEAGEMVKDICKDYGVGVPCVQAIVYGKNWKHVGGPIATKYRRVTYVNKEIGTVHFKNQ